MSKSNAADALLTSIADYRSRYFDEDHDRFVAFLERQPRCFERDCFDDGHVTGSAIVLNLRGDAMLLTHHAKLEKWLQLGGHADGDSDILAVAMREAEEESGLRVRPVSRAILDLDVHAIPARKSDPLHFHYDVRYLLQVVDSEAFVVTDESLDLAWVPLERITDYTDEVSVTRLVEKLAAD